MRIEPFVEAELTCDAFLGGKVTIRQPRDGYRAGVDPVLLAASVMARPGQCVLELGCGAGPALSCLAARVPGLSLTGVEIQPAYADLARRNLADHGFDAQVVCADIVDLPDPLRSATFDHVLANPPYFGPGSRIGSEDAGREIARAGRTPLSDWIAVAARRLAPGGFATVIQRAERLPDLLAAMTTHLGSVECLPLVPRAHRAARLVLLRGRKGGKAAFRLCAPVVLHRGNAHPGDADHYTPQVSAILRDGAALPFPTA
nr:methyltransferase domain-containing protein [Thalassococcus arenae]